jgi:hypothetical protein
MQVEIGADGEFQALILRNLGQAEPNWHKSLIQTAFHALTLTHFSGICGP